MEIEYLSLKSNKACRVNCSMFELVMKVCISKHFCDEVFKERFENNSSGLMMRNWNKTKINRELFFDFIVSNLILVSDFLIKRTHASIEVFKKSNERVDKLQTNWNQFKEFLSSVSKSTVFLANSTQMKVLQHSG